jgi:hypothetical protein
LPVPLHASKSFVSIDPEVTAADVFAQGASGDGGFGLALRELMPRNGKLGILTEFEDIRCPKSVFSFALVSGCRTDEYIRPRGGFGSVGCVEVEQKENAKAKDAVVA